MATFESEKQVLGYILYRVAGFIALQHPQRTEGYLECVGTGSCFPHHIAIGDAPLLLRVIQNQDGKLRQVC